MTLAAYTRTTTCITSSVIRGTCKFLVGCFSPAWRRQPSRPIASRCGEAHCVSRRSTCVRFACPTRLQLRQALQRLWPLRSKSAIPLQRPGQRSTRTVFVPIK